MHGTKTVLDISCWVGLEITYASDVDIIAEIGVENEKTVTGYNNYSATLPANYKPAPQSGKIVLPWSEFKQAEGWGVAIPRSKALATANSIKFRVSGDPGLTGEVAIFSVSSISHCETTIPDESEAAIANKTAITDNEMFTVKDNVLNVTKNNVDVSIVSINGSIVTKFNTSSKNTYDMSTLKPGIYMVKAGTVIKKVSIH